MRGKNKGSNAMRTPSNHRITGESSTKRRYKIFELTPSLIIGNFIIVDVFEDEIKRYEITVPIPIWKDRQKLKALLAEYKNGNHGK
jgi:hypothetical protein